MKIFIQYRYAENILQELQFLFVLKISGRKYQKIGQNASGWKIIESKTKFGRSNSKRVESSKGKKDCDQKRIWS